MNRFFIPGSQVKAGISNGSEFSAYVESGLMRAIGLSAESRLPGVDVPTLREGGLDAVLYDWRGVRAPPGIPDAHRTELEAFVGAMAVSPASARQAQTLGWTPLHLRREAFAAFLDTEARTVEAVLRCLGLAS